MTKSFGLLPDGLSQSAMPLKQNDQMAIICQIAHNRQSVAYKPARFRHYVVMYQ